jgi:threonine dehydrogenase-like Zn-dependent dehydrogenase
MRAITLIPGRNGSIALDDVSAPAGHGDVLARTLAIGVCGTDREIVQGKYGSAPPGNDRLVIGHESLAEVLEAPRGCGFARGDHVVGIVRRPDPVPCESCAAGEWDMCRNGAYLERGIKALHGYAAEQVRIEPAFTVKVARGLGFLGVLLEPASIVAKAWQHITRIGERTASWQPRRLLVTGAGPVGLLAALMGAQRGLEVHVFDRVESGPKPQLVRELSATYHCGAFGDLSDLRPDIIIECTGAGTLVCDAIEHSAAGGIVCLAGLSSGGRTITLDLSLLNRQIVLENDVVFGSVNANRSHYEAAAVALQGANPAWLARLITRRVPLARWREAFEPRDGDVKVVIDFDA